MKELKYLTNNIKEQCEQTNIKMLEIQLTDIRNNLLQLHTLISQFTIIISIDSKLEAFLEVLMDELKYVEANALELIKLLRA
jgi:hypothetical protein